MTTAQEMRDGLDYVEGLLVEIHERNADAALSDEDRAAWDTGREYVETTRTALADVEARSAVFDRGERHGTAATAPFHIIRKPEIDDVVSDRSATPTQVADALTRAIEPRVDATHMDHVRKLVNRHKADTEWTRAMISRSTDEYESGWGKIMSGRADMLSNEERTALSTVTNANGNFLVPTHLDPTVILSNDGSSNIVRQMARAVTLTRPGDTSWQGITSAGITASFDAQLAEVSDDSPTFSQPSIDTFKAQAFIQASLEATEDIPGLAGEILSMFGDAKDRLEGAAHCTGTGTGEPWGIFSALASNTNVLVTSTTAATIGEVDLHAMYKAVPVRFRRSSTWLAAPVYVLAVKRLGTAIGSSYSGDLTSPPTELILGHHVAISDDAPTTQTTTALDREIVFGDFSQYVIVDKIGSFAVQYIPALFNTANNLPDGRVGWYATWRTGADSIVDTAFRLLVDKTSA